MKRAILLLALTHCAASADVSTLRGAECLEAQHCEPVPYAACLSPTSPCVVEVDPDAGDVAMYYCDAGQPTCPRDTGRGTVLLGVREPSR